MRGEEAWCILLIAGQTFRINVENLETAVKWLNRIYLASRPQTPAAGPPMAWFPRERGVNTFVSEMRAAESRSLGVETWCYVPPPWLVPPDAERRRRAKHARRLVVEGKVNGRSMCRGEAALHRRLYGLLDGILSSPTGSNARPSRALYWDIKGFFAWLACLKPFKDWDAISVRQTLVEIARRWVEPGHLKIYLIGSRKNSHKICRLRAFAWHHHVLTTHLPNEGSRPRFFVAQQRMGFRPIEWRKMYRPDHDTLTTQRVPTLDSLPVWNLERCSSAQQMAEYLRSLAANPLLGAGTDFINSLIRKPSMVITSKRPTPTERAHANIESFLSDLEN